MEAGRQAARHRCTLCKGTGNVSDHHSDILARESLLTEYAGLDGCTVNWTPCVVASRQLFIVL